MRSQMAPEPDENAVKRQQKRIQAAADQWGKVDKETAKARKLDAAVEANDPDNGAEAGEMEGKEWFKKGDCLGIGPDEKPRFPKEHCTDTPTATAYLRSVAPPLVDGQDWYLIKPTGRSNCDIKKTLEMTELPPLGPTKVTAVQFLAARRNTDLPWKIRVLGMKDRKFA